jgi:hypothetical protein
MTRSSWIRNLFGAPRRVNRKTPVRGRLAVETLEDRLTPTAANLSAPLMYVEDTPLDLTDIVISDSVNATATLTLSDAAAGSLSTATSGTVTSEFAAGIWSATGPIADVNALLAGVVFTPSPEYNANFQIATSVADDTGTFPATLRVPGMPYHDQPTANDLSFTTNEETAFTGTLTGDDGDPEVTQTLTFATVLPPTNGIVIIEPLTGAFTYTPNPGFSGPDSFTFTVSDSTLAGGTSAPATVSITVSGVNDQPTANDLTFSTDEDTAFTGTLTGDDGDADVTQTLTFAIAMPPSNGSVTLDKATGAFTYTPDADYNGPDSFTFTVTDDATAGGAALTSDPATGLVTVNAVNDAPILTVPGEQTTPEDIAVTITGISVADVDVNEGTGEIQVTLSVGGGTLSISTSVAGGLSAGQISGNGSGSVVLEGPIAAVNATLAAGVTYLGNLNFNGVDTLMVHADDLGNTGGGAQTADATVTIRVLSPTQQVAALREMVQSLTFKNKGRLNSLLTKLRQVDAALARDKGKVAFNVAGAFLNHVRAFRNARILTPAQANPLIAAATQLRTSLQIGGFEVASPSSPSLAATTHKGPKTKPNASNAPSNSQKPGNGPSTAPGNSQHGNGGQDTPVVSVTDVPGHGQGKQNGKSQGKGK